MSKTLEEQMQEAVKETENLSYYSIADACEKVAKIYALEQQIKQLEWVKDTLVITGLESLVLSDKIDSLQEQLKSLKDGKE